MYSHVIYLSQNSTTTYAEIAMLVEAVMTLRLSWLHIDDYDFFNFCGIANMLKTYPSV